jgi:hypothetical protein
MLAGGFEGTGVTVAATLEAGSADTANGGGLFFVVAFGFLTVGFLSAGFLLWLFRGDSLHAISVLRTAREAITIQLRMPVKGFVLMVMAGSSGREEIQANSLQSIRQLKSDHVEKWFPKLLLSGLRQFPRRVPFSGMRR